MNRQQPTVYDLRIQPMRRDPELAASMIYGLKWTLSAMFENPFSVRDVVVVVREVVDNIAAHTDWDQHPRPALHVWYHVTQGRRQLCIYSRNVAKDTTRASEAVRKITDVVNRGTSEGTDPADALVACLADTNADPGGIGLLQIASSPRSNLSVRLNGSVFVAQIDVDVPELRPAA